MMAGGENRTANYGNGAYRLAPGSFRGKTKGAIPKNVFVAGHSCPDTRAMHSIAKAHGLPPHPATFPSSLPAFFIPLLTKEGDTVIDPFAGSNKVGLAAERSNRHWIAVEKVRQYVQLQMEIFRSFPGFRSGALGEA